MEPLARHWDSVYTGAAPDRVSWYEDEPVVSLRLLTKVLPEGGSVVDVGAGTSRLPERLLEAGVAQLTVLDVSPAALDAVRYRLGGHPAVRFVVGDVTAWLPEQTYDAWHDRAVFHFLVDPDDRRRYVATAASAVRDGGALVLGVFASDGPTQCSGLPTTRWEPSELAQVFAPEFALEHSEREEHVTPSGSVQPFTWVVLRRRAGPRP